MLQPVLIDTYRTKPYTYIGVSPGSLYTIPRVYVTGDTRAVRRLQIRRLRRTVRLVPFFRRVGLVALELRSPAYLLAANSDSNLAVRVDADRLA